VRLRRASFAACVTLPLVSLRLPREVVALEALARVLERRHLVHLDLDGLARRRLRDISVGQSAIDCSTTL